MPEFVTRIREVHVSMRLKNMLIGHYEFILNIRLVIFVSYSMFLASVYEHYR